MVPLKPAQVSEPSSEPVVSSASRHFMGKDIEMNWDRVAGNWKQMKGKAKEKWAKLTDDDLTYVDGKRDQLVGRIQERYGIQKDIAEKQLKEWESTL